VQQFFGYSLTGDTREQIFVFGHGSGGNGKGVLVNTAKVIIGDYAVQATMDILTASKHAQHSTDKAMLSGSRLFTASEAPLIT
jgi:putative DNA primase/helicase